MRIFKACFAIVLFLCASGCSRLSAFNTLVPKDAGVDLIENNAAYGAHSRQTLDIYRPSTQTKAAPVIVFVYGGSWNSGRKEDYSFVGRAFASRGYVTVLFDYRLVPEIRYPVFVQDAAAAIAWTYRNIRRFGGDPDRLYVVGHSAGAYNTMMVALDPVFMRKEGLSTSVVDAAVGLSGPYDFLPLDVEASREAFKGVADLPDTQPINHARGRKPPIFVATGEADELVKPRNTRALAAALRRSGNVVEDQYYADADHAGTLIAISRPLRKATPVLDDVLHFLSRH